jgi:polyisoprenoid-binding protein YceI
VVARYRIDPARSRVAIDARSSLHPIHSETDGVEGWLELEVDGERLDPAVAPRAHLELPVDRLRSGNAMEERELKRRIDARRFPTITGDLVSMEAVGAGGRYLVRGDVTFRGVTRTRQDEMTVVVDGGDTLRMRGASVFDIRDFGMEPPRILFLKVAPDVTVSVDIVARKEGRAM